MATSSASLDRSPRSNWVEETEKKTGKGLPPGIRKVARKLKQLHPEWSWERCIATAISMSKKWAAKGSAKGARNVAGWQALRSANKARQVATSNPADVGPQLVMSMADAIVLELVSRAGPEWVSQLVLADPESAEGRRQLLRRGQALPPASPGGRPGYPINDVAGLRKAMQAFGRASPARRRALVALIRRAARKLGVSDQEWVRRFLREHAGGTTKDQSG